MAKYETNIDIDVMDMFDGLNIREQESFIKDAIDNMNSSSQKRIFDYFLNEIKETFNLVENEDEEE